MTTRFQGWTSESFETWEEQERERNTEAIRNFQRRYRRGWSLKGWTKRHPVASFFLSTFLLFALSVVVLRLWPW